MPEPEHPLEVKVRQLLKQVGVAPMWGVSPLVQLMEWAMQSGEVEIYPELVTAHHQMLDQMYGWTPQEVCQLLLRPWDDPEDDVADAVRVEELDGLRPGEVAAELLDLLHRKMFLMYPGYPPASNLNGAYPLGIDLPPSRDLPN